MTGQEEREAVYRAENRVVEEGYLTDDELSILPGEVAAWCSAIAHSAGWGTYAPPHFRNVVPPVFTVAFDLPNGNPELDELAGYYESATDTIHLDPRIVDRWKVLHELAHALDCRDAHGTGFQERMVELVGAAFGDETADALRDAYEYELAALWGHADAGT